MLALGAIIPPMLAEGMLRELEECVRQAGALAIEDRAANPGFEPKPDGTLVTHTDRLVERQLKPLLLSLLPGSTVWGEEGGLTPPGKTGCWVVDPIDGTTNFAYGSPLWGVSVGLIQEGKPTLGVVFLPELREMYVAALGAGALKNGRRLPKMSAAPIRPYEPVGYSEKLIRLIGELPLPGKNRHSGAVVVDTMFTASGRFRGVIGFEERLYDIGGSLCVLAEVGAEIRNADGTPLDLQSMMSGERARKPWIAFPPDSGFFLNI